mmetsp:Transcript_41063/g.82198  ORF Transcript_41063/g.82198 Transcript_41063/m.82198 type:complete len:100 (+) Transcript_41063:461-760(+)
MMLECGHRFCKDCFDAAVSSEASDACGSCELCRISVPVWELDRLSEAGYELYKETQVRIEALKQKHGGIVPWLVLDYWTFRLTRDFRLERTATRTRKAS